jgi:hypothetical protein
LTAGGRKLVKLTDEIMLPDNIHMFTAVIVVDLSNPSTVLNEVQFYLKSIQECVKNVCSRVTSTDLIGKLVTRCKRKLGEKHQDM